VLKSARGKGQEYPILKPGEGKVLARSGGGERNKRKKAKLLERGGVRSIVRGIPYQGGDAVEVILWGAGEEY